jgi:hypothetical protein
MPRIDARPASPTIYAMLRVSLAFRAPSGNFESVLGVMNRHNHAPLQDHAHRKYFRICRRCTLFLKFGLELRNVLAVLNCNSWNQNFNLDAAFGFSFPNPAVNAVSLDNFRRAFDCDLHDLTDLSGHPTLSSLAAAARCSAMIVLAHGS